MRSEDPTHTRLRYTGPLLLLGALAVAGLGWLAIRANLDRACTINDTPYLDLCVTAPDRAAQLRAQIAANPGDTAAYVELALAGKSPDRGGALAAASLLAPTDPRLQKLQVAAAVGRNDLVAAVAMLVSIVENHVQDEPATVALAHLLIAGHSPLLEQQLRPGAQWPARVLARLQQAGGSIANALPLVARALATQALEPAAVAAYISRLKNAQAWTDAYSLWATLHGRSLPLLYNGGFDQPFVQGGFDWEPHSQAGRGRAGVVVERSGAEGRGAALDIRFTGRPIGLPMISQHIFVGQGRFRLQGSYKSSQMRVDPPLAWTVRCTDAQGQVIARSAALEDSGNAWKQFAFDFETPPGCGSVASLELAIATAAPTASGRGRIWFDALSLERLAR